MPITVEGYLELEVLDIIEALETVLEYAEQEAEYIRAQRKAAGIT